MGEKPTASEEVAARESGIGSVSERQGGATTHEATHTAQQQAGRLAGDLNADTQPDNAPSGDQTGGPAEATNLNSSKSNAA